MISYSSNEEFNRLQSEAIQRVREMQMKANSFINPKNSPKNDDSSQIKKNNTSQNISSNQRNTNSFNNDFFIKKTPDNNQQMNKQQPFEKDNKISPQNNFQQNHSKNAKHNQSNIPHQNTDTPPPSKEAPPKPNQNSRHTSNPFAQLFGSNLGGFNKYKSSNTSNQGNEMIADISKGIGKFFNDLSIDEEKLLILILIYILFKNGADIKLLIALLYLIL